MLPYKNNYQPFVSIITLNYNQTDVTCAFLESTKSLTYNNYEILVCDMNSRNDPTNQINQLGISKVKVFVSKDNLGFAAGNNWGIKKGKGDFYLIINNDTIITAELLEKLVEPFMLDSKIGVTCPKIKYYSNPDIIQYAGFHKMNMYTGRSTSIGDKFKDNGQFDNPGLTFGAHGCAMMVKKEVIQDTGMFPEIFFLYYEEWDWSIRIQKAGYGIFFQPYAIVYHKESMTVGKQSVLKTYYLNRNRILFMRRNCSTIQLVIFSLYLVLVAVPKNIFFYLTSWNIPHLKAYIKALKWNLLYSSDSIV